MNKEARVVRIIAENPALEKPRSLQARIIFDPPNDESVLVFYWRGSKEGFFDATVEHIAPDNCFKSRCRARHDYVNGLLKPFVLR